MKEIVTEVVAPIMSGSDCEEIKTADYRDNRKNDYDIRLIANLSIHLSCS